MIENAIQLMKTWVAEGLTLREAANRFRARHPDRLVEILDTIGSYPSSEPELRALQAVYP